MLHTATATPGSVPPLATKKASARARVQAFRSGGARLDLLVSQRSARDLDRIAKSLSTSRRHVVEALIRIAAENPDQAGLRMALGGQDSD